MSKKDYQAVARAFYEVRSSHQPGFTDPMMTLRIVQNKLTELFSVDNPRFDRARFTEACETGKCKGMRAS